MIYMIAALLTRSGFAGRVAVLATAGLLSTAVTTPASVAPGLCSEMTSSASNNSSPDYAVWDALIKAHVKPSDIRGMRVNAVDYEGMRAEPNFDAFVKSLETAPTSGLGKDAEYALWINSYNVLAIKMVADHPCKKSMLGLKKSKISSIKDIGTLVAPVWKKTAGIVGGQTLSLDDIENVKLRAPEGYAADPLLHACIVCASASCPDVALTAYKPETLQADMEANMRDFLTNTKKGLSLDKAKGVITLSKVFQWFEGDFTTKAGNASVIDALLPYMPEDIRAHVSENKSSLKVEHFDYDWGLNGASPGRKDGKC